MSKYIAIILLMLSTLSLGTPAYADVQKCTEAIDRSDHVTALNECKPLAEAGDAVSQAALGWIYRSGVSIDKDDWKAIKWFGLAAEQGNAFAQNHLGMMYEEGAGTLQDYKEAVKLYKLSATQGTAYAQFNLARMYETGHGVVQDFIRAHMWANIAAYEPYAGYAAELRDKLTKEMTSADVEKAQDMARECVAKEYRGC